jgi:hypothetical protein
MAGHLTATDYWLDHQFHQSNDQIPLIARYSGPGQLFAPSSFGTDPQAVRGCRHSRRASRILPHGEFLCAHIVTHGYCNLICLSSGIDYFILGTAFQKLSISYSSFKLSVEILLGLIPV